MTITTKVGDRGKTKIKGKLVSKDSELIEVLGSIDELMAVLGFIKNKDLKEVSKDLYILMGYLAGYEKKKIDWSQKTERLEKEISKKEKKLGDLNRFMNSSEMDRWINLARTVCRRVERRLVKYIKVDKGIDLNILKYINRLSDYLFIKAIKQKR